MIKNVIRHDDKIYIVNRMLPSSTSEETANRIHNVLGTDTLLRNQQGDWFCCKVAKEVEFKDIDSSKPVVSSPPTFTFTAEDLAHTQFELGDNGGLG